MQIFPENLIAIIFLVIYYCKCSSYVDVKRHSNSDAFHFVGFYKTNIFYCVDYIFVENVI